MAERYSRRAVGSVVDQSLPVAVDIVLIRASNDPCARSTCPLLKGAYLGESCCLMLSSLQACSSVEPDSSGALSLRRSSISPNLAMTSSNRRATVVASWFLTSKASSQRVNRHKKHTMNLAPLWDSGKGPMMSTATCLIGIGGARVCTGRGAGPAVLT